MKSPESAYLEAIYRESGYFGTWLPGIGLQLGDYGVIDRRKRFTVLGNIRREPFRIDFEEGLDEPKTDIDFKSSEGVEFTIGLAADVSNGPETQVRYNFSRSGSYLFKANNCKYATIKDQSRIGDAVLREFEKYKWKRGYILVTECIVPETTSILLSSSNQGLLELKVKGDLTKAFDIASAGLDMKVTHSRDLCVQILAKASMVALYRFSAVRKKAFLPMPFDLWAVGAGDDKDSRIEDHFFGNMGYYDIFDD